MNFSTKKKFMQKLKKEMAEFQKLDMKTKLNLLGINFISARLPYRRLFFLLNFFNFMFPMTQVRGFARNR